MSPPPPDATGSASEIDPPIAALHRDAVTLTGYLTIGAWAYFIYIIGPATTLIQDHMGLTDAMAGFIGTTMAVGMVVAGVVGPASTSRVGRVRTLLRALMVMIVGVAMLAGAPGYPVVVAGAAVTGLGGAVVANTVTAILAHHHPRFRAQVITEANAAAAWIGLLAPLVLGAMVAAGWGWRAGLMTVAIGPIALLLPIRSLPRRRSPAFAPEPSGVVGPGATGDGSLPGHAPPPPEEQSTTGTLPLPFWFSLVAVTAAVGAELGTNFWAATLVAQRTGVPPAQATGAVAAIVAGVALGRTLGAQLPRRFPVTSLIPAFLLLAAAGLAVLIAAQTFLLALLGLFLTGLGLSILFPMTQSLAIHCSGGQADRAVGLTSIAAGIALGLSPFVMGALAGAFGVLPAFAFVFVILAAGLLATLVVRARIGAW